MEHKCSSDDCDDPVLKQGDEVVQLLRGPWYDAITPGPTTLESEWHHKCFREFSSLAFYRQHRPYYCETCRRKIKFGEEIYFYVIGKETDECYTVSEGRGYEIYHVTHVKCP
ncbi:MAG: hypothetical protein WCD04_05005 [Terriglobia bacterium]|jgi:hypothetical protein